MLQKRGCIHEPSVRKIDTDNLNPNLRKTKVLVDCNTTQDGLKSRDYGYGSWWGICISHSTSCG